ncbi:Twinfilin-1 [Microbotryomycetes sp. JL201]|nr:Twinfilin-1 [Microbotryomycetes sp. JL201]
MAAQSGIQPSRDLLESWTAAVASPSTRLLRLKIQEEHVVLDREWPAASSFADDFRLMDDDDVVTATEPAYYLMRLDTTPDSQWIFYSFVPDEAHVRSKMLYASSRNTCSRALGDQRFAASLFATTRDAPQSDLSYSAYQAHETHEAAAKPMSEREKEMADIKAAEAKERREGTFSQPGVGRSMLETSSAPGGGNNLGLAWSEQARTLVERMTGSEANIAQFQIENEEIVPVSNQPSSLSVPAASPSFTLFRHSGGGIVFIYCCPPTSPVKSRLLYSSSTSAAVAQAKAFGADVVKKLETSDPDEVTDEYVAQELSSLSTNAHSPTPLPQDDKPAFSRPARPGRKR